jgi:ketosteroid isomerase-like protein
VTPRDVTDLDVRDLIRGVEEATSVFIRGDMRRYVELVPRADDYTLMAPSGGEPRRGFDDSDDALDALEQFFRGGEAELDVFETYASGDLAVLVAIERQHGEVGGLSDQDWSLRVTQVFRREGSDWRLVHRHADPLVREISHEHVGALARGDADAS